MSALQHPAEDPLAGHDAVAGDLFDGATVVALLADLGHFQEHAVADGDPVATEEVGNVARYLAQGITNCINFANPDLIVIGDEYAQFGEAFLNAIKAQVEQAVLPSVYRSVRIELSSLTEDTVLKGTFLDVFSQTYLGAARDAEDKPESGAG